jgi:hypothetical protein
MSGGRASATYPFSTQSQRFQLLTGRTPLMTMGERHPKLVDICEPFPMWGRKGLQRSEQTHKKGEQTLRSYGGFLPWRRTRHLLARH